jgi:ribosomal protein L36
MKVKASVKNLKKRQGCKLVKRGKVLYVINKLNRRFKAKQG